MGSVAEITLYGESRAQCIEAANAAFAEFDRVEKLMSVFDSKSQLSMVNHHSHETELSVDRRIVEVLQHAGKFYEMTDGAFDVTVEPLMELYGFRTGRSQKQIPSDKEIIEVVESVGMNKLWIDPEQSTVSLLHPRTQLDFGGIAVGYALDRAVASLKSFDIESALINHSGDIFALGAPPDNDGWDVGITDPLHPDAIITSTKVKDKAISTSGNYENYIDFDGVHYGHILNPQTGEPASVILSSTVIANSAVEADALSTGTFVMGVLKGMKLVESLKNLQLIAVTSSEGREEVLSSF
jgi:thiamine biosynthesis lipoprotein